MPCLCISSGCQLHPAWRKEEVLVRAMQLVLTGCCGSVQEGMAWLKYGACIFVVIWGGKDGEDAEWRQQPLQDTSFHPCCKTVSA